MIKPLEDKIVLEVPKQEEKTTSSGLIIAGSAEEKPSEAIVVAVGPGVTFADGNKLKIDVVPGDKVLFSKYSGSEVKYDGKDYLIVPYRDIFAVIN